MRFVFFTDLHLWNRSPSKKRKDDYAESVLGKLSEIVEYVNSCDFGIFGGDFFEQKWLYDFGFLSKVIGVFATMKKPIYYIWGQHDLSGSNEQSCYRSTFAFIAKFTEHLRPILASKKISGIRFTPCHVWMDLEKMPKRECEVEVLVAHKLIMDKRAPFECHSINELDLGYDLVLSGDYHGTFLKKRNGTIYANPGSVGRRRSDDNHNPSIFIITVEGKNIKVKRKLLGAKPFNEVYDENCEDEDVDDFNEGLSEIAKTVRRFDTKASDIFDLVNMIVKSGDVEVDSEVVDFVMSKR